MDYVVAIPSYNREQTLKRKTLAMLERHHIPKDRIHIFVASEEQRIIYQEACPGYKVITAQLGLANARNFISDYFPIGQPIMSFDDDVSEIKQKSGTKLVPIPDLSSFIVQAFLLCQALGYRLFGLYPAANGMFMKEKVRLDLSLIVGPAWGILNPGKELRINTEDKEDHERTILMYIADGGVIRYENITPITTFYKGAGGLVETRTIERVKQSADYILQTYPDYSQPKKTNRFGYDEIKLKCKVV